MERLYREYSPKGIQFLHCLSGDAARTGRDFQKHYRSEFPHLIDPNRRVEKQLNKNGWPFYVVVDAKGNAVFAENCAVEGKAELEAVLEAVAPGKPAKTGAHNGTVYLEETLRKNKAAKRACVTAPALAAAKGDCLYLAYVTDHQGRSQVFVQRLGAGGADPGKPVLVSEGYPDAYDAAITADVAGAVWIFYTGLADAGSAAARYDIFVRSLDPAGAFSEPVNLTESDDDAMHPAAAVDAEGRVCVAYYRWHKMGFCSRDKEIYARCRDGDEWCDEIRLSPEDLPAYEDHTDPAIAAAPGGGVIVAWSWDMHPLEIEEYKRYQNEFHADAPTIFGRHAEKRAAGELLFLGEAGLDGAPALFAAQSGDLWCAWNALGNLRRGETKGLFTSVTAAGAADRSSQHPVEVGMHDICTPRFFEKRGRPGIVWASQDDRGEWTLKTSVFEDGEWSRPETIEKNDNPRFPAVAAAADGTIYLAFTKDDGAGRAVAWRKL